MEKRMNYFYCFLVLLAWVCTWQPLNAMAIDLKCVDGDSPRCARSDSQRDDELLSPPAPKTPNNSPREDLKEVKKASGQSSAIGVESKHANVASRFRDDLQQYLVIMKNGVLMAPELTARDEELYPLHWAVRHNNPAKLKKLLRSGEYDVNEHDSWGATPLYWAAMGVGAGQGGPDCDRFGREVVVGDDQEKDTEVQKKAADKIAKREIRYVQNNIACFDLLLDAGADPDLCTEPSTIDYRLVHREEEDGDLPDWSEGSGLCKAGGDSVAHVLFALYNVGEVRLTTWLGYIVRLIQHDANFKIKNNAGLEPIDLVDRKLRTRVREIVEEKQAAFKLEMDDEAARSQNASSHSILLSEVWKKLVTNIRTQQGGRTLCDKLDRALAAVSVVEVVE